MSKDNIKDQKKSKKEENPPAANIPGFGLILSLSKYKEIRWGLFVVLVAVAYVLATNPDIVAGWFGDKEVTEEPKDKGSSKVSQKEIEEKILNELLDGSPEDVWEDEEEEDMVFE